MLNSRPKSGKSQSNMPDLQVSASITCQATLTLNEVECRALDALIGYGIEPFLKVFYEKMGRHYLEPHERGLRELFKKFGQTVHPALSDVQTARQLVSEAMQTRRLASAPAERNV